MLLEEFLAGIGREATDATVYAYKVINGLYMTDTLETKESAYDFFKRNRNDFNWIDELDIGRGGKVINTCKKLMDEEKAKKLINGWFCFEIDKIEICGPAYYEATDWNFIRFMVKGYSRVLWNDALYDIYR